MNLSELLSKYRFTLKKETQLWRFVEFNHNSANPLKMQRLEDRHIAFFNFSDLQIDSSQCETIDCEQLRVQLSNAEKQRKSEWQQLNKQLKMISAEIDNIIEYFDEMSIDLIKKKLKRLSGGCEKASY